MLKPTVLLIATALFVQGAYAQNGSAPAPSSHKHRATSHDVTAAAQDSLMPHQPARTSRPPRPALTVSLGLDELHDDNILQLTPIELDRLATNPGPPRFRIDTADDNITALHGDVRWRLRLLSRRETRVAAGLDFYIYQRNDVKDWQQYGLSLDQELTASRRYLATIGIWRSIVPNYYLREITDEDDSFGLPRRDRIRRSVQYRQISTGARYGQQLARGRLDLSATFERLHRDYDPKFDERDNDNDQWRFVIEGRPFRHWDLSARFTYLVGTLDARGDLATSEIRDTDISYDHHGFGASVTLPWGHNRTRGRVDVGWMPQTRSYTTDDKFDLIRFGRINHRRATTVKVAQRVWGPLDVVASYDRLTSEAEFTTGVTFDPRATDFDQTRYGIMLRSRWDLLAR